MKSSQNSLHLCYYNYVLIIMNGHDNNYINIQLCVHVKRKKGEEGVFQIISKSHTNHLVLA